MIRRVTVKYIITEDNSNEEELDAFVKKCLEYDLRECCYQISMNFKEEKITTEQLKKISYLFGTLVKNGINKVFLDYHIMQRLNLISNHLFISHWTVGMYQSSWEYEYALKS